MAVLDADKEGFLRSETSLIQTIGRAARNVNAEVILYADRVTDSMQRAMDETARRRKLQLEYNKTHGITPRTVVSAIKSIIEDEIAAHQIAQDAAGIKEMDYVTAEYLEQLQEEMLQAAKDLDFERAAQLRDTIRNLKRGMLEREIEKAEKEKNDARVSELSEQLAKLNEGSMPEPQKKKKRGGKARRKGGE